MYLGVDLGTSAVKAVLVDQQERPVAQAEVPLEVQQPAPGHSEQDPAAWLQASLTAVDQLKAEAATALGAVRGVGLSGQMHGAVLLGKDDRVLRPAIIWNDGRSAAECLELERSCPQLAQITGNRAMPGFTAPKLLWVAKHEPEHFDALRRVLLPKDYLRLHLSGEHVSDMSDAAGTLWLDVQGRRWSASALAATGLSEVHMPRLVEGSAVSGQLRPALCTRWGMQGPVTLAGGGGDNAAGAVGIGALRQGGGFLSLGTSGVYFIADDSYRPNPAGGVHTFCHAVPERWHRMGVILSAAACLSWLASLQRSSVDTLMSELKAQDSSASSVVFLPYLSGERTPHNDPLATGCFLGLGHATRRADLTRAVLEGVAFAFADAQAALAQSGPLPERLGIIGGGARSDAWLEILATVLGRPLDRSEDAARGAAFGAARLARLSCTGESANGLCSSPKVQRSIEPNASLVDYYGARLAHYRSLYPALQGRFVPTPARSTSHDA